MLIADITQDITTLCLRFEPYKTLVNKSVGFSPVGTHVVIDSPISTDSRITWYQIELLFFRNVDSGIYVLWITDILSPYLSDGHDNGIPIILSLYIKPRNFPIPISMVTNLALNTEVSIVG